MSDDRVFLRVEFDGVLDWLFGDASRVDSIASHSVGDTASEAGAVNGNREPNTVPPTDGVGPVPSPRSRFRGSAPVAVPTFDDRSPAA